MTPEQVFATALLGARAAGGVVSQVEQVHRSFARWFVPSPRHSVSVQELNDGEARPVYGVVRGSFAAAGLVAGAIATVAMRGRGGDLGARGGGGHVVSALNAVIGEQLDQRGDPLGIRMAVRVNGRDMPPVGADLAAAFPDATARLAVFVHGLGENEHSWRRRPAGGDETGETQTYGTRLARDFGYTPVYVRYNTGRHVSTNGRELAALLRQLFGAWPRPVEEILLVGHSMGGLVIRAACHYGAQDPWVPAVRRVVYLGSPHAGAPLARGARLLAWTADRASATRPYAPILDHSPGIRDLRFGYVSDDDWLGCDAGTCLIDHGSDVPLLATADHFVVAATVTADARHPAGRLVGDLLVQPSSAHGARRSRTPIRFRPEHRDHHGRMTHLDLLNHPAVYDGIRAHLEADRDS